MLLEASKLASAADGGEQQRGTVQIITTHTNKEVYKSTWKGQICRRCDIF